MKQEDEEILKHCMLMRSRFASYNEVYAYLEKNGVDEETQKEITRELEQYDVILETEQHKAEMRARIQTGIKYLIISGIVLALDIAWIYIVAKNARVIFNLQIFIGIFAFFFLFRGLLMVISGKVKMNERF